MNSNDWLITNSQLHFADELLHQKNSSVIGDAIKPNAYSLVDLAGLIDTILFSDTIVTLPNSDRHNSIISRLEEEKLLFVLEPDETIDSIILRLRGSWKQDPILSGLDQELDEITKIIADSARINFTDVRAGINNTSEYAMSLMNTPDWKSDVGYTLSSLIDSNEPAHEMYGGSAHLNEYFARNLFLRSLLYFMIANEKKISFSPDSVRMPLTAYLNQRISNQIYRHTQSVLDEKDKELGEIYNLIGYNSFFEVLIPSTFRLVLKNCNGSKDEIINATLDLRKDKEITKFREWLSNFHASTSSREKISKLVSQRSKLNQTNGITSGEVSSVGLQVVHASSGNVLSLLDLVVKGGDLVRRTLTKKYSTRRLTFLRNLGKTLDEISFANDDLEKIFGYRLSQKDIDFYKSLRSYQKDYLQGMYGGDYLHDLLKPVN